MEENSIFVKGNPDEIVKRFSQIHTVTIYCPLLDEGIRCLRASLISTLSDYMSNESNFEHIPIHDAFNAFMYTLSFCRENEIDVSGLYIFWGCVQSFKCLKYVNCNFVTDVKVYESYNSMNEENTKENKIGILSNIYHVDILEFNLSNMFSQEVIDIFNKVLMFDGIISNSYLKRQFIISFDYDSYVTYMNMFLNNNGTLFESMDSNIIEYFRMFPTFIADQKPIIRIITNYRNI